MRSLPRDLLPRRQCDKLIGEHHPAMWKLQIGNNLSVVVHTLVCVVAMIAAVVDGVLQDRGK